MFFAANQWCESHRVTLTRNVYFRRSRQLSILARRKQNQRSHQELEVNHVLEHRNQVEQPQLFLNHLDIQDAHRQ